MTKSWYFPRLFILSYIAPFALLIIPKESCAHPVQHSRRLRKIIAVTWLRG